jgi:hypothetical protein
VKCYQLLSKFYGSIGRSEKQHEAEQAISKYWANYQDSHDITGAEYSWDWFFCSVRNELPNDPIL